VSFGVVSTGFSRPSLNELIEDVWDIFAAAFGDDISRAPGTPQAQLVGNLAAMFDIAWQAAEDLYNQNRPSTAQGVPLTQLGAFIGIDRLDPTVSIVIATVTGPPGTPVLTSQFVRSDSGDLFRPTFDTEISGLGTVTLGFAAFQTGPIVCAAGELTEIVSAGTGWASITNGVGTGDVGGQLGSDGESDEAFRQRYAASTELQATNILESLYAALLAINGVTQVRIYVNDTAGTVAGRPAHSYEVVIEGGADADIAEAIWAHHPAGITLFGSTTENITDSQGQTQAINFSRPTPVDIVVAITTATGADFPSTGVDDIKAAIVSFGPGQFGIGDDVNVARLYTPANSVQGHVISALTIDGGTADVTIDEDEVARFTTANITVNGA
jgi:uncharacterized phage protein gp47/JayE